MELIFHLLFSFLATVTFGIITNIPRKALVACGITGMTGWMIYYVLTQTFDASQTFANFLGTVGLGIASIFFFPLQKNADDYFLYSEFGSFSARRPCLSSGSEHFVRKY